ncbi:thiolase domain protein [Mycobacterium xenopi 3993]|nr:thiolase domain protein [Mycobacterium xenopi 3993]
MTPLAEAVIQLRGAGGARQVPGAAIALVGGIGDEWTTMRRWSWSGRHDTS